MRSTFSTGQVMKRLMRTILAKCKCAVKAFSHALSLSCGVGALTFWLTLGGRANPSGRHDAGVCGGVANSPRQAARGGLRQLVRSTQIVSRLVPNVRTAKLLARGSWRNRVRGLSSGMRRVVPLCHRPRSRTLTAGFALMFMTYCDFSPNSETNQNWSPTRLPSKGVWRVDPTCVRLSPGVFGSAVV